MKLKLSIVWLLLVSAFTASAVRHNVDSTIIENYVTGSSSWEKSARNVYFWDGQCKKTRNIVYYSYNSGTAGWDSSAYYAYTFDANGDEATSLYKFGTGTLEPYSYLIYTRSSGVLTNYISQYWYSNLGAYRNTYKYVYHYNGQTLQDTVWTQGWDTVGNTWQLVARYIYAYDAAGNDTLYEHQLYDAVSMSYTNDYRFQYTFTPFNRQSSSLRSTWNTVNSTWKPTQRITSSYDGSENLTGYLQELSNDGGATWTNYVQGTNTNNSDGQPTQSIYSIWNAGTSAWEPSQRYTYYYGCIAATGIEDVKADNSELYPNPGHNSLTLTIADLQTTTELSIFNMMGEKMIEQAIAQGANHITIAALASGVYLLKWQDGSHIITRKFIKE